VATAAAVVLAGFWARLVTHGFIAGPEATSLALAGKEILPPARLAHALALAYLVAVLVPRRAAWMDGAPAAFLALIGRHSLQVFCVGLPLAWGISHALARWGGALPLLDLALVGAGVAVLAGVAWSRERRVPARLAPAAT